MYHDVMNPKPSMGYHPNSQVQKANTCKSWNTIII